MPVYEFELYEEGDKLELDLFNEVDQEKINIEGAPFTIWKFDLEATRETDDAIPEDGIDLNYLYGEALPENMVFGGPFGPLKGSFLEPTWTQELRAFGISEPEEINIKFNKQQVLELLGRPFIIGDLIKSHRGKHYVVEDAYVSEEIALWEYIHINVIARKVDTSQMSLPGETNG
jgi:hypothetical protein